MYHLKKYSYKRREFQKSLRFLLFTFSIFFQRALLQESPCTNHPPKHQLKLSGF